MVKIYPSLNRLLVKLYRLFEVGCTWSGLGLGLVEGFFFTQSKSLGLLDG